MIELISRYNPFKQTKSAKALDEKEEYLNKMEDVGKRIDQRIIERRNRLRDAAENLESTVKEALESYDDFRNH